jgi:hypothetical protein
LSGPASARGFSCPYPQGEPFFLVYPLRPEALEATVRQVRYRPLFDTLDDAGEAQAPGT